MAIHFKSKSFQSKNSEEPQKEKSEGVNRKAALKKATFILVADNCQARVYRLVKFPKVEEICHLEHLKSRLRNQDLVSATPGRSFQRGGNVRYSYEPETTPKQLEGLKFAKQLIDFLNLAHKKEEFNRLYIIAEPSFLGLLRQQISHEIQKTVVAEVAKEMTSCGVSTIETLLSEI